MKKQKKVQAVAEEENVDCGGICLGALDVCPVGVVCDSCPAGNNYDDDKLEPGWTTIPSKVFAQPTAASSSGVSLDTKDKLPRMSSRFHALQGDEDSEDDTGYCSGNYAGNYADVGADARKQQTSQKGLHAFSLAPLPSLCAGKSRRPGPIEDPGRAVPRDRCDEMSPTGGDLLVTIGQAASDHKADRESMNKSQASPEHKADRESMSKPDFPHAAVSPLCPEPDKLRRYRSGCNSEA